MPVPVAIPEAARDEAFGGVTYHITGDVVPVLNIEISQTPVYFEHHVLLWKDPKLDIGLKPLKGALKRVLAGMPVFVTQTQGSGRIGFSRDGAGHIIAMHLKPGDKLDVREHQFLAATDTVDYTFNRVKGLSNVLFSGSGFFIDTFSCTHPEGIVWLHGYGNIFEVNLQPGEQIDIEPGGWVYKDHGVQMETKLQSLSQGLFASAGQLCWNRFTGPGRVGIQSMYMQYATE
jgi:uncharacterized protein (AIM24 family)